MLQKRRHVQRSKLKLAGTNAQQMIISNASLHKDTSIRVQIYMYHTSSSCDSMFERKASIYKHFIYVPTNTKMSILKYTKVCIYIIHVHFLVKHTSVSSKPALNATGRIPAIVQAVPASCTSAACELPKQSNSSDVQVGSRLNKLSLTG